MTFIESVILAVVQAATEFLPISSSGHLVFVKELMNIDKVPILFDIVLHVGSLTAILLFYRKRMWMTFRQANERFGGRIQSKSNKKFLLYIAISTMVTFLYYLLFKDTIESKYQSPSILAITFLVTTVILLSTCFIGKIKQQESIHKKGILMPLVVGIMQGLALLPGISRSGATITPLLHWKIKREDAAYFSFFLAVPAIMGALVFKLIEMGEAMDQMISWPFLVVSFVISLFFSYLFLSLIRIVLVNGRFWMFSIYTLGMAVTAFLMF